MKPTSYQVLGHERLSSANSSTIATATIPRGTSAIEVTVETTSCRATFTTTDDPTTSTGLIIQKDQMPWFIPVAQGVTLKFASTAGTASVIQIAYLS